MASWSLVAVIGLGLSLLLPASPAAGLPRPVLLAVGVGVAWFLVAAATSATPALSILGRYPRYEGVLAVLGYCLAMAAGARLLGPSAPQNRDFFTSSIAVAAVVTAVVAVIQLALDPNARVIGLLGNSSILGGWASMAFCLIGWRSLQRRHPLWLVGLACAGLTVLVAASRAAWLGLGIALIGTLAVRLASRPRPRWWVAPAVLVGFGLLAWLVPQTQARVTGSTPFATATVNGRLLLWADTWPLVAEHPLTGVGPSRFVDAIGAYHSPSWAAAVGPYAPPDSPHNVVLQVLAATGPMGLAACLALVVTVMVALWHARPWDDWQSGTVTALVALATGYLFSFTDPVTTTLAMVILGGAAAAPQMTTPPWRRRLRLAGVTTWLVVASILAGTALIAEARYSAVLAERSATPAQLLEVASIRPWDADLAIRLGRTFAELAVEGSAPAGSAIPLVSSACSQLPSSSECAMVLGDLQTIAGEPASAVATLQKARRIDPNNVDLLLKLGIAQAENDSPGDAEASFLQAANLRPTAPEPWRDLATLYRRIGRDAEAAIAEAKAEKVQPR
ncbi:MAG TPA: O-antigen ligase family protein [Propionicimonas sp.]